MREQVIVWRSNLVEMFEQLEWYLASYDSKQVIVSLEEGGFMIGTFRAYEKDFYEMFFMSQDGYNYEISRIKEWAYLE